MKMAVQSSVTENIKVKSSWKTKWGRKMYKSNGDNCSFERIVKQSPFKNLGTSHLEWTAAGVSASRATHVSSTWVTTLDSLVSGHSWTRDNVRMSYLRLSRERIGPWLSGPKSSFQKVHFAFHLETKVPESGGSVLSHIIQVVWGLVWSFQSKWWFGAPCHQLVMVYCVLSSQHSHLLGSFIAVHDSIPSADKLYGNATFIFQQDLAPASTAKSTDTWFNDHCAWLASKLTWPNHHRESIGYFQ